MSMTLDDLIAKLETVRDELTSLLGGDTAAGEAEVRLAIQPSWPFEHSLADDGDELPYVIDEERGRISVYLAEAGQIGYLPGDVAGAIGWS